MALDGSYLVPPASILKEYAVTAEQFVEHGYGFVYEGLIKRGRLQKNERVLDLGCGLGYFLHSLRGKGFNPVGVDIAETAVSLNRDDGFRVWHA